MGSLAEVWTDDQSTMLYSADAGDDWGEWFGEMTISAATTDTNGEAEGQFRTGFFGGYLVFDVCDRSIEPEAVPPPSRRVAARAGGTPARAGREVAQSGKQDASTEKFIVELAQDRKAEKAGDPPVLDGDFAARAELPGLFSRPSADAFQFVVKVRALYRASAKAPATIGFQLSKNGLAYEPVVVSGVASAVSNVHGVTGRAYEAAFDAKEVCGVVQVWAKLRVPRRDATGRLVVDP